MRIVTQRFVYELTIEDIVAFQLHHSRTEGVITAVLRKGSIASGAVSATGSRNRWSATYANFTVRALLREISAGTSWYSIPMDLRKSRASTSRATNGMRSIG